MKILGFHDDSACGYYRITMPLDAVAYYGKHDIQTSCGWSELAHQYPIIIGQRVSREAALPIWRRLRPKHRLIYETDDDVFTIDNMNVHAKREHSLAMLDAVEQAVMVSHAVTVSTKYLGETLRKWNPNITVLPNVIDGKLLSVQRPQREKLTVGWAGGYSHYTDWQVVSPSIKKFLQRNKDIDFHVVGTNFAKIFKVPVRETKWLGNIWDYYRVVDFDIGLAPLAPIEFNRSKSHIKALEYAALGIPTIASDMEPYRDFIVHGETGYLVKHDHEWGRYLRILKEDDALRKEMGAKAKDLAADWTIQRRWKDWEQAWLGE